MRITENKTNTVTGKPTYMKHGDGLLVVRDEGAE